MIDVMEQSKIPTRELYSGEKIPCVGLGTFGSDKYGADAVSEAVYGAVKYGYRLIDCASVYQNEDKIGQVLHRLFEEKVVNFVLIKHINISSLYFRFLFYFCKPR